MSLITIFQLLHRQRRLNFLNNFECADIDNDNGGHFKIVASPHKTL